MKLAKLFVTAILFVLVSVPAFADSGKAVIPSLKALYVRSGEYFRTLINVTNITDNKLSGTIKLYKRDGTLLYDDNRALGGDIESAGFFSYSEGTGSGATSISFTINPRSTGSVYLTMKSSSMTRFEGYGVIDWENVEGDDVYGLVAHGYCNYRIVGTNSMENSYAIPINNGMPF